MVAPVIGQVRVSRFDVQHRDCFDSLAAMRDAGGARLIVTSPPYPDARTPEQYGCAGFDTSVEGYGRLGEAVFEALVPGGVCALNIDGPVRKWRGNAIGSERSLIAFKVAIDWAERVGFRYVEHCAYLRNGTPGLFGPRWRSGWEPMHVFARPGAEVQFDVYGFTVENASAGRVDAPSRNRCRTGWRANKARVVRERGAISTGWAFNASNVDHDHAAPFPPEFADAYVLCYSRPDDIVGDPFFGSGTVPKSCQRHGRRFIGGDLGHREAHKGKPCGRRWADIVNESLQVCADPDA